MFTGAPSSAVNLGTNTGPNALLVSASYPLPSTAGHGPLTTVPLPGGFTYWRIDTGTSGQFTMPNLWGSPTQPYVYNNTSSNLGGIIPAGGLTIDGYAYPAGTYVFQFMDFSQGIGATGTGYIDAVSAPAAGVSVLFRGCRFRGGAENGYLNVNATYTTGLYYHYCDLGAVNSAAANESGIAIDMSGAGSAFRAYRCYISYPTSGIFANIGGSGACDVIENFIEKLSLSNLSAHLNGISLNGGNLNASILRNHIVIVTPDEQGNTIDQTDCIAFFQDFGTFPGSGHNTDGTKGYWVNDNYCGGTGYCFYFGQNPATNPNTVNNMNAGGNLLTTSVYSTGGSNGAAAAIPSWGSFGNSETANTWADGANKGQSWL